MCELVFMYGQGFLIVNVMVFFSQFFLTVTWNQYDGVAYVYGDQSVFDRFKGYFSRDKTVEYRTRALLCFLPKWEGFLVDDDTEKMNATKALVKLQNVVKCLSKVWTEENRNYREREPSNFDARKVH